jgi:hypothetical protein
LFLAQQACRDRGGFHCETAGNDALDAKRDDLAAEFFRRACSPPLKVCLGIAELGKKWVAQKREGSSRFVERCLRFKRGMPSAYRLLSVCEECCCRSLNRAKPVRSRQP